MMEFLNDAFLRTYLTECMIPISKEQRAGIKEGLTLLESRGRTEVEFPVPRGDNFSVSVLLTALVDWLKPWAYMG